MRCNQWRRLFSWRYVRCIRACSHGSGGQQSKHCFCSASRKCSDCCALGHWLMDELAKVLVRRKQWFCSVNQPDPSTFTWLWYWSWPGASKMTSDLLHLVRLAPCWFWRKTLSLTVKGLKSPECSFRDSVVCVICVQRASSFAAHAWCQVGWTLEFQRVDKEASVS